MIEAVSSDKRNLTFLNDENVEKAKLWHKREDLITVGVVTYSQNFLLKTLINCFKAQTSENWKMIILHDGPVNDDLYSSLTNNQYLSDERILFITTDFRHDDYGHSLRNIIIEKYLNSEWLLLTNGDNYYTPNFIENMENEIDRDKDISMVAFPCILQKPHESNPTLRINFSSHPGLRVGSIDIGQFIVRKGFAKEFKLNPTAIADGEFCVQCANLIKEKGKKIYRTYSIDFVHNN
jgi:hypothetical protein